MSLKIPPVCDKTYYSAVLVICTEQKGMKNKIMKLRVISFIKRETILTVSFFLALLSCFLVKPDREYLGYFTSNMGTMIILFCLMAVVAGLGSLGVFRYLGERLLERIRSQGGSCFFWCFCVFFGSMLITNDVALITFVPFGS